MSNFPRMFILVLMLTGLGTAPLVFITVKYYWGERGTPPPTGAERRRQRGEELTLRAKQIEHAKQNPISNRRPDFWDNRKIP